ncbi:MAG: NAD(P)-dependent oxidoreductase [Chloroflexota bacterium]|nr:NAD(P)-dependent oxidoreductase [Chloroflexota bacterium]
MLSRPTPALLASLSRGSGDTLILGAAGKMGPTLARMARRALDELGRRDQVIAVSRWSSHETADRLRAAGVETIPCDLLDRTMVATLPDAPNVIFMAGQKFGTSDAPAATWAMNTVVPAIVAERYAGSRIVAFSTGNVYPLTPVARSGSRESDAVGPIGEYANSCVGRERVFEYYSARHGTLVAIVRLNYAIDLRYGVLVDIARRVAHGEAIDLRMGYVNVIWQGDANARALQCLEHAASPPFIINIAGREMLAIRDIANRFGETFGRPPNFIGQEAEDALLSDASLSERLFGPPIVSIDQMMAWVADWVRRGGPLLDKPTHFETRDGKF